MSPEPDTQHSALRTQSSQSSDLSPQSSALSPSLPIPYAYQVHQLSFSYQASGGKHPGPTQSWALKELGCEIRAGEVFGVIGPNGSGKSSLLKLLARLLTPREGQVVLLGENLAGMRQDAVARLVALVPQESQQVFPFTIAEVVLMGRFPHHRSRWNLGGLGWETK